MKVVFFRALALYGEEENMGPNKLSSLAFLTAILILISTGCDPSGTTRDIKAGEPEEARETLVFLDEYNKDREIEEVENENAPRVTEFILGAGDELEIAVYRKDELNRSVKIGPSGKIMYPLVGDIQAAGLNIFQLRDRIREGLSRYIVDPQVSVGILSIQSQKIIVLGEVNSPGFFQGETAMTALEAISRAGGFTLDGKQKSVLLIRGGMENPELRALDLEKALKEGALAQNVVLRGGDIIYVPRTYISNVDRFFGHLSTIISPIVSLERAYLLGDEIISGESRSVRTR